MIYNVVGSEQSTCQKFIAISKPPPPSCSDGTVYTCIYSYIKQRETWKHSLLSDANSIQMRQEMTLSIFIYLFIFNLIWFTWNICILKMKIFLNFWQVAVHPKKRSIQCVFSDHLDFFGYVNIRPIILVFCAYLIDLIAARWFWYRKHKNNKT